MAGEKDNSYLLIMALMWSNTEIDEYVSENWNYVYESLQKFGPYSKSIIGIGDIVLQSISEKWDIDFENWTIDKIADFVDADEAGITHGFGHNLLEDENF